MPNAYVPPDLVSRVAEVFDGSAGPAYAQLATAGTDGVEARTVHVGYESRFGTLTFNTHAASRKLHGLAPEHRAVGCYYHPATHAQWQWEFTACLVTGDGARDIPAGIEAQQLVEFRAEEWRALPADVRAAYLQRSEATTGDATEPCPSFVTVVCVCSAWTVFDVDWTDYGRSRRTRYVRRDQAWVAEPLDVLYSE